MTRLKECPDCDGSGVGFFHSDDYPEACDRCGSEGLVPAFPLVLVHGVYGQHLLTAKYVADMHHAAMCYLDGWQDCAASDEGWHARPSPGYADVRDFLLYYETDFLVACQVALHITRPNECFFLRLPVLF